MGPYQRTPFSKLLELLDTQVEGSVQWVLLEISWNHNYQQKTLKMRVSDLDHRFVVQNVESVEVSVCFIV